jgi:hypothetical protein
VIDELADIQTGGKHSKIHSFAVRRMDIAFLSDLKKNCIIVWVTGE